jgi:hypothetical protein
LLPSFPVKNPPDTVRLFGIYRGLPPRRFLCRHRHAAPLELLIPVVIRSYKHGAPLELFQNAAESPPGVGVISLP